MQKNNSRKQIYCMALCAVLIAMSIALNQVKIIHMPYGGSITLFSMLAATLTGYFCGPKWGITSGIALGILNIIIGGYIIHPAQLVLDYFLAFGCLGFSGFFRNMKGGLYTGYAAAVTCRFICSFLSGFVFFAEYAPEGMNPVWYSFIYNLLYLWGEGVLTLIVLALPPVKNALARLKNQF